MDHKPFDHAFPYKDTHAVVETFADGLHLVTVDGSTARITLTVSRGDPPKPNQKGPPTGQKVTAARLVMPMPAFLHLFNQMNQLVVGLEQQGHIVRDKDNVTLQ